MTKCVACRTTIVKSQEAKERGYVNAGPWILVRIFRIVNGADEVAMELECCSLQCFARFADLTIGKIEPIT